MNEEMLAISQWFNQLAVSVGQALGVGPLRQSALHPSQGAVVDSVERARFQSRFECQTLKLFAGLFHQR